MSRPKLIIRNAKEQRAVDWFKSAYGNKAWVKALEDGHDRYWMSRPEFREVFFRVWCCRPFGNSELNSLHQLARIVYRRSAYFRDLPLSDQVA